MVYSVLFVTKVSSITMNRFIKNNPAFNLLRKFTPNFIMNIYKLNTSKSFFLHILDKMTCYLFYYINLKQKGSIKVVIFAQGRTGSTLLENLICSTGYFKKGGERFKQLGTHIKNPYKYITGFSKNIFVKRVIFHLKFQHFTVDRVKKIDPANFLQKLQNDGWKIIYLRRENKFNHALSNLIADHRGSCHKKDSNKESIKIKVDPEQLINMINKRLENDIYETQVLSGLNYLPVIYEKDLENSEFHQTTIDKILDYLNLERRTVFTDLNKINKFKLKDLIQNYDEVINALEKNNFLRFLKNQPHE